jgi:hypothetical protein
MLLNKKTIFMRPYIILLLTSLALFSCDTKKTSIAGTVINKTTGKGVYSALVTYIQCAETGDNCTEMIIGQTYTIQDGSFKIDQKRASKSKKRWLTVYVGTKKLAQFDNVSLMDKNIVIEVTP